MASADFMSKTETPRNEPGVPVLPPIRANEGQHLQGARTGRLRPTLVDTPLDEMRNRFRSDGYLFVKNLIPREEVLDIREHYFTFMRSTGILEPGSDPREGVFNSHVDPLAFQGIGGTLSREEEQLKTLVAAHSTPEYLAFVRHPSLLLFAAHLMQWKDIVLCERTLLRHNAPGSNSTAIHYDKIFLRAGDAEFLTAWVPIGDCAPNGGGLIYLERSMDLGEKIEADFAKRALALPPSDRMSAYNVHMSVNGTIGSDAEGFSKDFGCYNRWLTAEYGAGDVVFHDPHIIHVSGKNEDASGRIRLSTDLRFYEKGAAMDQRWMKKWHPDDHL